MPGHGLGHEGKIGRVATHHSKTGVARMMRVVPGPPGGEIVVDGDAGGAARQPKQLVGEQLTGKQLIGEVAADKPGASYDEEPPHGCFRNDGLRGRGIRRGYFIHDSCSFAALR